MLKTLQRPRRMDAVGCSDVSLYCPKHANRLALASAKRSIELLPIWDGHYIAGKMGLPIAEDIEEYWILPPRPHNAGC